VPEEPTLFDTAPKHPGIILRKMLSAKGWTQDELAAVTGRSRQTINELISGKVGVTPEMAIALAAAFGNDAAEWMNWDSAYRLSIAESDSHVVQQKAYLYGVAPVREMQKRGWIKDVKDLPELEAELKIFFNTDSLDKPFLFPVSGYRAESLGHLNTAERAWCFRARHLAGALRVSSPFDASHSDKLIREMRTLAAYPQEARRAPQLLASYGIRLVVVEPLASAKIDGAAFWIDRHAPVIAVTIRYDRMDCFWFTIMHEFAHIRNNDMLAVDIDLVGDKSTPIQTQEAQELRASAEASAALIPSDELDSFIRRVGPLYSKTRIIQFAHRMKIHPSIIVGQLQHRKEIKFTHHHQLLPKMRSIVTEAALTDGYGKIVNSEIIVGG
jgi:HTH-type transcriptional regulator/antitoxin HigA